MIPTPVADVVALLGARVVGQPRDDLVSADVEVDSRLAAPGGLFVALPGERTDGHDHAAGAVARGAVAAITSRPLDGVPCLVVPDPLEALQALARELWTRHPPLTYGITGSSGKTSTKDLLAQVLAHRGPALSPVGSFNNELGLPLTSLRREVDTRFAVLEYSARGLGHIRFLTGIVQPNIAVVLNVGSAHLGEFGSPEVIAEAKGELVEQVALACLNADDPLVLGMAPRVTEGSVVTYGTGADADVRACDVELDRLGRASFTLRDDKHAMPPGGREARVDLRLHGAHHVSNALASAAAVLGTGLGVSVPDVARWLGEAVPQSRWRMEVTERPDGVTVVNDAYNANPESMRAALQALTAMSDGGARRTVAVLGPMAELGEHADGSHADLGALVSRLGVDRLVVVGAEAQDLHDGAVRTGATSVRVDDVEQAVALLREDLRPGDVVLVKASRSAGLERVAARLLEEHA